MNIFLNGELIFRAFLTKGINKMTKFRSKKMSLRIFYTLLFSIVFIGHAYAHKVIVFAWVEGNTVYTESKFSGGKKVKNAPIEVFDAHGKKLLDGQTDESGKFSFKVPQKNEMKIVLLAGMGHRGEWTITRDDFGEEIEENIKNMDSKNNMSTQTSPMIESKAVHKEKNAIPCLTSEEIQMIVEKTLEKQMNPLLTKLNKLLAPNTSPDVSDIFAGIGYILGLMGIGAYFNYRRKKE
jgi:nickel transport protein